MTLQVKEGGQREGNYYKQGGSFAKRIAINFACFLLLPKNGSIRNNGLKDHLTYDFDFAFTEKKNSAKCRCFFYKNEVKYDLNLSN